MDIQRTIAQNVKAIREQKKLTLDAAAEVTGVSRSMLAQLEKGDANPTIAVLWRIANGYKVSFTALTDQPQAEAAVIRQADIRPIVADEGRYLLYPMFLFEAGRQWESYHVVILPQGALDAEAHTEGAEEYITAFEGELAVTAEGVRHTLKAGDALRFRADGPHRYESIGKAPVHLHMLIQYRG